MDVDGKGMIIKHFKSLLFAVIGVFYALTATAAISVFSEYGLIQNVQNYSTNPFWSPNAPYNQRLPQPVYVQGADLNADDCINVVQSLVSVQCMARDNCKNAELSDVRPAIMVQLSNLPGANYVSSCSGYIDGIFESYKRQYANTLPNRPTAFPDATVPNPDLNDDDGSIKFENPYKRQTPKWQQEQNERAAELQALQRQNGVGGEHVQYTDFPATYADLSFSERIENDRTGLEPFKDLKAYKTLDIKTAEEWCGKDGGRANSPECVAWRDCTDTIKPNDSRIVHAEYDSSHKNCLVTKCESGFSPNKQKTGCIDAAGKDCTDNLTPNDANITKAEYNNNGECKVTACMNGYHPNVTGDGCDINSGADCTSQYEEVPNVKYAEIDSNGDCIVLYCDDGYKVHPNKKECEEDTSGSTSGNNGSINSATYADCMSKVSDKHATKAEFDKEKNCKIKECKPDVYHPSKDGKKCEEDSTYYYLDIYFQPGYTSIIYGENYCFAVCGVLDGGDEVNKVLKPILGSNYCVQKISIGANILPSKKDHTLQNILTGEKIKFTYAQYQTIRDKLMTLNKTSACDWFSDKIHATIYKHDSINDTDTQVADIILDD